MFPCPSVASSLVLSFFALMYCLVLGGCSTPTAPPNNQNPPPPSVIDCSRVSLCDLTTVGDSYMCFEDSLYVEDFGGGSLAIDQGFYEQAWVFAQPNGIMARMTLRMYLSLAEPCDMDLPPLYCYVGGYLVQSQPGVTDPGTAYITFEEIGTAAPPLVSWGECEYLSVVSLHASNPNGVYVIQFNDIVLANTRGDTRVVSIRMSMI